MTADTPDHARALEVLGNITPGDWHVGGVNGLCQTTVRAELGERVALVDEQLGACGDYNARAIAAVPALVALYAAAVELEYRRDQMRLAEEAGDAHPLERVALDHAEAVYAEALANVEKAVNRG